MLRPAPPQPGEGGGGFTRVITDDVRSGPDAVAVSGLTTLP
jgi:hypothetical protein